MTIVWNLRALISQKRLEKNCRKKTIKIFSEEIIMRYVQL
jgi:hypothetical protein